MARPALINTNLNEPIAVTLKAFQVGFGDCFLLTFHYGDNDERHILIDFGSTGLPKSLPKNQMILVAQEIEKLCKDGCFFGIVATHRHKDHVSGFSTQGGTPPDNLSTGDVIRSLNPDVVIMPWTEHPDLETDSRSGVVPLTDDDVRIGREKAFTAGLRNMQAAAGSVKKEAERLGGSLDADRPEIVKSINKQVADNLRFMGDNNLSNLSAVKNLMEMAAQSDAGRNKKGHYVHYRYDLDLSTFLPGVKVTVLGPPTLEQYENIAKQRSADSKEFWMLRAAQDNYWGVQAAAANLQKDLNENEATPNVLFPGARAFNTSPAHTRWLIHRLRSMRGEQLLGLVRILDDAMNNTSVILLFEVGDKKLLFPGDAQIENWEYALKFAEEKEENLRLLRETTFYKVGHHGSRNATPRTLWETFGKKAEAGAQDGSTMHTVNSTMPGKHGIKPETAVPRETLVTALRDHSHYHSTEEVTGPDGDLFIEIPLQG